MLPRGELEGVEASRDGLGLGLRADEQPVVGERAPVIVKTPPGTSGPPRVRAIAIAGADAAAASGTLSWTTPGWPRVAVCSAKASAPRSQAVAVTNGQSQLDQAS